MAGVFWKGLHLEVVVWVLQASSHWLQLLLLLLGSVLDSDPAACIFF